MPTVTCDKCFGKMTVPDAYMARRIKCTECHADFMAVYGEPKRPPQTPDTPSPQAKQHVPSKASPTRIVPTRRARAGGIGAVAVVIALMAGAFVLGQWYGRRSVANEYQAARAGMKHDAQHTQLPVVNRAVIDPPQIHQQTVQEMIDADPLISQLAEGSGMTKIRLERGEYPDNEISMMILTGKMTPSDAEHVREFCESVRRHTQP